MPDLIRSDPTLGGTGEIAVLVGGHKDPINVDQEGLLSSQPPNGYGYPWRNVNPEQYNAFPYLSDLFKAPAPVDLSAVLAAVNDAKTAAVAAQTAAQNAAAAAQSAATAATQANTNAAAAAQGVGQVVTKLDNAGKAL